MSPRKKLLLALRALPLLAGAGVLALAGGSLAIGTACCLTLVAADRGTASTVSATVASHSWSRTIEQLELREVEREDWCDDMPDDALILDIESKKKGIGKRRKYKDWCTYASEEWVVADEAAIEGGDLAPRWPTVADDGCERVGCRRPGERRERYAVVLETSGAEPMECELDEAEWAGLVAGSPVEVGVGGLTGKPLCDTLTPSTQS